MRKIATTLLTISFLLLFLPCRAQQNARWLELPANATLQDVHTAYANIGGHSQMRSFTYCYSTEGRISLWVAYPLNRGLIGDGSRGDCWVPSPDIPESAQAVLHRGFKNGSGYDRGHQIPSADRLDPKANAQTFTFVNATPQDHEFNAGIWAELEKLVRTWAKRSDTLYVVTGALPGKKTIADNVGNPVNIPFAYWKAVLRRNTDHYGTTRWSMCAVLLPHEGFYPLGTWQENAALLKDHSLSIDDLERTTGLDLFPHLKEVLPEDECAKLEKEAPSMTSWWWR